MSDKDRVFRVVLGGLVNPDAHLNCGAKDPKARVLEPIHWGTCDGCRDALAELYLERYPKPKTKPKTQDAFSFMAEDAESGRMVANETGRKRKKRG